MLWLHGHVFARKALSVSQFSSVPHCRASSVPAQEAFLLSVKPSKKVAIQLAFASSCLCCVSSVSVWVILFLQQLQPQKERHSSKMI